MVFPYECASVSMSVPVWVSGFEFVCRQLHMWPLRHPRSFALRSLSLCLCLKLFFSFRFFALKYHFIYSRVFRSRCSSRLPLRSPGTPAAHEVSYIIFLHSFSYFMVFSLWHPISEILRIACFLAYGIGRLLDVPRPPKPHSKPPSQLFIVSKVFTLDSRLLYPYRGYILFIKIVLK